MTNLSLKSKNLPKGHNQDVLLEPRKTLGKEALKHILQKCGLKITDQRIAILKALNSGPRWHKTAQNILDEIKKTNPSINIGFATIYRFLKTLKKAELISKVSMGMGAGSACYELKSNKLHYHMACVKCDKIVEFKNQNIENILKKLVLEKNYTMQNQIVEIYVICNSKICNSVEPSSS